MASGLTFPDVSGLVLPAVRPGANAMNLSPTLYNIGMELRYSGDASNIATCTARFKKTSEPNQAFVYGQGGWRNTLPVKRQIANDIPYKAFYISALMLEPGTSYDIEMVPTVSGVGSDIITGTVTTQAEPPTLADVLARTPDYYVSPTGGGNGLSSGSPMTLSALLALSWTAGQRRYARMAPGFYNGTFTRAATATGLLTLFAQNAAITSYNHSTRTWTVNGAQHSVIRPAAANTIVGGGDNWEQIAVIGPGLMGAPAGVSYNIYRSRASYDPGAQMMTVIPDAAPTSYIDIPLWKLDNVVGTPFNTAAGWVEFMNTNIDWNVSHNAFGWWRASSSVASQLYMRLPEDADPDAYTVLISRPTTGGLTLAADMHVYGVEVQGHGVGITEHDRTVISHCEIKGGKYGFYVTSAANGGTNSTHKADGIIQYSMHRQTSRWRADASDAESRKVVTWPAVKTNLKAANGVGYSNRILTEFETNFNYGTGCPTRHTIRFCSADQSFNAFGRGHANNLQTLTSYDRYAGSYNDFYRNKGYGALDEMFEPEGQAIEVRFWDNWGENCALGLGFAPVKIGNLYVFRNVFWRCGDHGSRPHPNGLHEPGCSHGKYGTGSDNPGTVWMLFNTIWTNSDVEIGADDAGVHGIQNADGNTGFRSGQLNSPPQFRWYGNIVRVTGYVQHIDDENQGGIPNMWGEDYNLMVSAGARPGAGITTFPRMSIKGATYTTPATYRAALAALGVAADARGEHSNKLNGVDINFDNYAAIDALLANPTAATPGNGGMLLAAGTNYAVATAVVFPNVADVFTGGVAPTKIYEYSGSVPSFGWRERDYVAPAEAATAPAAPTSLTATKSGSDTINLAWVNNATDATGNRIERSLDLGVTWETVTTLASASTTYANTGLPGGATRHFRVAAVNAVGSSYSNTASATTDPAETIPAAPTGLFTTPVGYTSVLLNWVDVASNEISYLVKQADDQNGPFTLIDTLGPNTTEYLVDDLSAGVTKYWHVIASNTVGESLPSNVASGTTPVPTSIGGGVRVSGIRAVGQRVVGIRSTRIAQTLLISFDTASGVAVRLNGYYPLGIINWGTGIWYLSGPFTEYPSKSLTYWDSLDDGSPNSESFTFVSPKILVSLRMFNSSNGPITITVNGAGGESKIQTVPAKTIATITTGFTVPATTITLASTHGWHTNFDDLVIL